MHVHYICLKPELFSWAGKLEVFSVFRRHDSLLLLEFCSVFVPCTPKKCLMLHSVCYVT